MESDEEYERRPRGRDKFRRERSDYQERSGGRREDRSGGGGGNRRDDSWQDNRRGRQQQWDQNQRRNRDNYQGGGGRHHENQGGPPMKRQRRDWDNQGYNNQGDYQSGGFNQTPNQWGPPTDAQQHSFNSPQQTTTNTGPSMLTFKQFLNSQADDIEDMEAVRKYQDYKLEFRKTQIADFFTSHKDEEWFRNKYHPGEALAYQNKLNEAVRKRAAVYIDLLQSGWLDRFSLTAEQGEEITKLLDAAVIKFEGGTEFDLQVLDEKKENEQGNPESNDGARQADGAGQQENQETTEEKGVTPISPSSVPLPEGPAPSSSSLKPESAPEVSDASTKQSKLKEEPYETQQEDKPDGEKTRKRKRRNRDYDGESESESESDSEPMPPGDESAKTDARERAAEESLHPPGVEPISSDEVMTTEQVKPSEASSNEESAESEEKQKASGNQATGSDVTRTDLVKANAASTEAESETVEDKTSDAAEKPEGQTTELPQHASNEQGDENKMDTSENAENKDDEDEDDEDEDSDAEPEITTPRALHLTVSLFVRSVPPKISHYDIDSLCARFPGYMRVVLSDPAPERKFSSRGWITFKPDVNIKDICWSLNNIKIKDVELNPIVNRDLSKRVRTVSGAAVLKGWVETDITMATRLIMRLDEKFEVWKQQEKAEIEGKKEVEAPKQDETVEESEGQKEDEKTVENGTEESEKKPSKVAPKIEMPSSNPVLDTLPSNISEKIATISDGKSDESVLPEFDISEGSKIPGLETSEHPPPEIDEGLVKLLDRLLLYLRVVHSLDYYSGAEYLYEDDMPNRCGIIHIRSPLPDKVNYEEVSEWYKNLHQKLDQHLQNKETMKDEEAAQLGKKDQEQEVEKFIQANTQEITKDKWLCPLSGKKFRGPEFVRKHIFNKHPDKVDEVKTEVTFFNNFVYDPKRPSEVEVKAVASTTPVQQGFQGGMQQTPSNQGSWGRGGGGMHYGNRGGYNNQYSGNFRSDHYNRGGFQKSRRGSFSGGQRHDTRPILQYRDLDAPGDDSEFF